MAFVRKRPCVFCGKTAPDYLVREDGCWEWVGSKGWGGYGTKRVSGKDTMAHRWTYEQHKGPIPPGLVLDHLCRNRACVNPDHLEPVTFGENLYRGRRDSKDPTKRPSPPRRPKQRTLAKLMVLARASQRIQDAVAAYQEAENGRYRYSLTEVAARFGVTAPQVSRAASHAGFSRYKNKNAFVRYPKEG